MTLSTNVSTVVHGIGAGPAPLAPAGDRYLSDQQRQELVNAVAQSSDHNLARFVFSLHIESCRMSDGIIESMRLYCLQVSAEAEQSYKKSRDTRDAALARGYRKHALEFESQLVARRTPCVE